MATGQKLRAAFLFLPVKSPDFSEESLQSPSSKSNQMKTVHCTIKSIGLKNTRESSLQEASTNPTRRPLKHTHKPFSNFNSHRVPLKCRVKCHANGQCNRLCEEWCLVFLNLNRRSNLLTFLLFLPNSFNNEPNLNQI